MIKLNKIDVIFNKGTRLENHVLKAIDLKIGQGEFVTIIGGNGAGKSTLMNVLSGDVIPQKGQIFIGDQNVTRMPTEKRSRMVSRVFQDPMIGTFSSLTIEENMSLAYHRGCRRGFSLSLTGRLRGRFQEVLSSLEIDLEKRMKDKVETLSGGQRQALSLVMATLQDSQILLLDEHTAALDPKIAHKIMELTHKMIRARQLTALMITHSMSQALEYGDRTIMLYHGQVVQDMQGANRTALSPQDLIKYFDL